MYYEEREDHWSRDERLEHTTRKEEEACEDFNRVLLNTMVKLCPLCGDETKGYHCRECINKQMDKAKGENM